MNGAIGWILLITLFAYMAIGVTLCIGGQVVLNRISCLLTNTERFRMDEATEKHLRDTLLNGSQVLYWVSIVFAVTFCLSGCGILIAAAMMLKDPMILFELYYAAAVYAVIGLPGLIYVIRQANRHISTYGHKIDLATGPEL